MKTKSTWLNKLTQSQKGMSLTELMVAVGLGSVVSAAVAAIFIFALESFTVLVEQNNAEEQLLWSSYQLRSFFGQAIEMQVQTGGAITTTAGSSVGQILRNFTSANDGATTTLAAFSREASLSDTGGSDLIPTAIYFVNPTTTPVGSSSQPWGGVLIFDLGPRTGMPPIMIADINDVWYDRISYLQIKDVECSDPNCSAGVPYGTNAKSATFVIRARYFREANKMQWIYGVNVANTAAFRDIEMNVKVGFRNNVLLGADELQRRVGTSQVERLHGGLYFFRMALPPLKN